MPGWVHNWISSTLQGSWQLLIFEEKWYEFSLGAEIPSLSLTSLLPHGLLPVCNHATGERQARCFFL